MAVGRRLRLEVHLDLYSVVVLPRVRTARVDAEQASPPLTLALDLVPQQSVRAPSCRICVEPASFAGELRFERKVDRLLVVANGVYTVPHKVLDVDAIEFPVRPMAACIIDVEGRAYRFDRRAGGVVAGPEMYGLLVQSAFA